MTNEKIASDQDPLERIGELQHALAMLVESWSSRVLTFVGEEGIGKTHLLKSIVRRAGKDPKVLTLYVGCKSIAAHDAAATLLHIRIHLSRLAGEQREKFRFLAFDLAICRYTLLKLGAPAAQQLEQILNQLSDPAYRRALTLVAQATGTAGLAAVHVVGLGPLVEWALNKALQGARIKNALSTSSADEAALTRLFEMDEGTRSSPAGPVGC
jgi:Cdc6-like AAA superfamily ATPase